MPTILRALFSKRKYRCKEENYSKYSSSHCARSTCQLFVSRSLLSESLLSGTKACSSNLEVEAQIEHQVRVSSHLLKNCVSAGLPKLNLKSFEEGRWGLKVGQVNYFLYLCLGNACVFFQTMKKPRQIFQMYVAEVSSGLKNTHQLSKEFLLKNFCCIVGLLKLAV